MIAIKENIKNVINDYEPRVDEDSVKEESKSDSDDDLPF